MSLLLRAGYWTHGVGKMHFRGRSYGFRNLLTMEEGVAHRVDDDYLRYLRNSGVHDPLPQRDARPALLPAADQRRAGAAQRQQLGRRPLHRVPARARPLPTRSAVLPVVLLDRPAPAVRAQRAVRRAVRSVRHAAAGIRRPAGARPAVGTVAAPRPPGRRPPRPRPHAPHPRPLLRPDRPGRRRHRPHHGGAARAAVGGEHGGSVHRRPRRDARRPRPVAEELPLRAVGARAAAPALAGGGRTPALPARIRSG